MVVDPQGPPCPCGQRGCWERYASGPGLERLARRAGLDAVDGPAVVRAARSGDRAAQRVMDEFADWVALGLANVANLLDPQLLVVGGGLADAADAFLPRVRDLLAGNPTLRFRSLAVEAAQGGSVAGALGAALLAAGPDPAGPDASGPDAAGPVVAGPGPGRARGH
jgi:glucokinase